MRIVLPLLMAFFFLSSCGPTIQVFYDQDRSVKLSDYKTYSWFDVKSIEPGKNDPRYYNELTNKRVVDAVNSELESRGFRPAEGKGQLDLHYHIVVDDKSTIAKEPAEMLYGPYWEGKIATVYQYREGTLIIDIMDTKTSRLVWRGWATDLITEKMQKHPEEAIRKGVKEIFKKFLLEQ